MIKPLAYTLDVLNRAAIVRKDDARVRALLGSDRALFVPVWNQRNLVDATPRAQVLTRVTQGETIFLGLADETPWFALSLPESETPPDLGVPGEFRILNDVVSLLPGDEASILAYARGMVIWHANHRFCGRCGAPAAVTEAGHSRSCTSTACNHRSFPRTDPVVITLVTHGDKCLLGRQAIWPPGMYSCIAGFVEPGETLETAVRREIAEETSVQVDNVRYMASQPWPFPASIMLGFRAEALTTAIHRNDDELEDCRWFTKNELRGAGERNSQGPGFKLPNRFAIARHLIEGWLAE